MEPAHFEAALNGDVSKFPFCDMNKQDLSDIFYKVSPSGNSLLHVASSSGQEEMTQLIAHKFSFLTTKKNSEGNTPLHLAVRAQKLNTVRILVHLAKQFPNTSTDYSLLTMKNDEGNTALHEALFAIRAAKRNVNTSVDIACFLVLHDPDVSCHQNNAGKSPLCLAIESGNKEILEYILNALPNGDSLLQRLEVKSPVHVAIEHKKMDMLRLIKEQKEELLLLRDEEGNTPLHFAAYIGYIKVVRYLLDIKTNWASERNNKGFYPLHLACENGHIEATKELFRKWPDPTELLCNKGQSILHVAAKSGKEHVVRYILNEKGTHTLVNKMDDKGNTPCHLAALHGHSMVVVALHFDKRLKADLLNSQGLTAYDIFKLNIFKVQDQQIYVNDTNNEASGNVEENFSAVDLKGLKKVNQYHMMMTYSTLYVYYELFRYWQIRHHHHRSTSMSRIKIKPPVPKQDLNNTINYLFVVAALLVSAAFASALQIPFDGGNSSDYARTLLSRFLLNNIITMNLSITAAFGLFLALQLDTNLATVLVSLSFLLLEFALTFMGTAFFNAMVIRMKTIDYSWPLPLETIIYLFQQLQKAIIIILSVGPFILGRQASVLIIYFILFCFYFPLHRLWSIIYFNSLNVIIKFVFCASIFLFLLNFVSYWALNLI